MSAEIRAKGIRVLRIHVAGDFYDAAYTRKWFEIIRKNRGTVFFTYSRSWRIPELRVLLQAMALERNCLMWWSWDRETGPPPRAVRVRRAYMSVDNDDVPSHVTDLTFRARPHGVMKFDRRGNLVCPHENGVTKLTCTQCKLCFTSRRVPKQKRLSISRNGI